MPVYNPTVLNKYTGSWNGKSFEVGSDEWSAAVRKILDPGHIVGFRPLRGKVGRFDELCRFLQPTLFTWPPLRGAAKPCDGRSNEPGPVSMSSSTSKGNSVQATHPRIIATSQKSQKGVTPVKKFTGSTSPTLGVVETESTTLRGREGKNPSFRKQKWELDLNLVRLIRSAKPA